jgi:hypothetical protein
MNVSLEAFGHCGPLSQYRHSAAARQPESPLFQALQQPCVVEIDVMVTDTVK